MLRRLHNLSAKACSAITFSVTVFSFIAAILGSIGCRPPEEQAAVPTPDSGPVVDLAAVLPPAPEANIIIVSFDALRADALGIYGYDRGTSPNIDRWAEQALVFDRAYSAAPVTPTSFAAAFTSQLPFRTFKEWNLVPSKTLAESLSTAGYRTSALINNSQVTEERGFHQGFTDYEVFDAISDDEVLERGIRWLVEHQQERFFLWLHFLSPHSPYEYRARSGKFYDPAYKGQFQTTTGSRFETEDAAEAQRIRNLYDGEIYYADDLFGELLEFLEEQGLLETSILVLTADHGEEFKERGSFQHRYLHEETVRIPLIVAHPRASRSGRTETFYSNVDLWPTLAALVEAQPPETSDGWNLLQPSEAARAFASIAMTDQSYRGMNLRKGNDKLILTCVPEVRTELYDLAQDPGEINDLATTQEGHVRDLLQMLRLVTGAADPCRAIEDALAGVEQTEGLAPETIESLRALGYIQ